MVEAVESTSVLALKEDLVGRTLMKSQML